MQMQFSPSGSTFWIKADNRVHGLVTRRGNKLRGYLVNPTTKKRFDVCACECNPGNVVARMSDIAAHTAFAVRAAIEALNQ